MRHLPDHEIQAWLEGDDSIRKSRFQDHLKECDGCRDKFRQYQWLYHSLENQDLPFIPADFADRVMNPLFSPSRALSGFFREKFPFAVMWSVAGFFVIRLIRWELIWPLLVTWTRIFGRISEIMRFPASRFAGSITDRVNWLVPGIGIWIVIMLLDRFIQIRMKVRIHSPHDILH